MTAFIIVIHVIVCALLIALILVQRGRGGGLLESFSDVESIFGTKTDAFLSRTTAILSTVFFITCLSLALLSARQSRSLLQDIKVEPAAAAPIARAAAPTQVTPNPTGIDLPLPLKEGSKAEEKTATAGQQNTATETKPQGVPKAE